MCVIVHVPAGVDLPDDDTLYACHLSNSDGSGLMFYNEEDNIIEVNKSMDFREFMYLVDEAQKTIDGKYDLTLHFRIGTCGKDGIYNVHPFYCDPDNKKQSALCHNGQLFQMPKDAERCDSHHFAEFVMAQCPPSWWHNPAMLMLLSEYVKSKGDRVVVQGITERGPESHIFGTSGEWKDGVWYSNGSYKWRARRGIDSYEDEMFGGYGSLYGGSYGWAEEEEIQRQNRMDAQRAARERKALPAPTRAATTKFNVESGDIQTMDDCDICCTFNPVIRVFDAYDKSNAQSFVCEDCAVELRRSDSTGNIYYYDEDLSGWEPMRTFNKQVQNRLFHIRNYRR